MPSARSQDVARHTGPEFVLPQPPRPHGDLRVERDAGSVPMQRAIAALPAAGRRMGLLLECQELFLGELRAALAELQGAPAGAAATESVRVLHEILDWCGAVQRDLVLEARHAQAGEQPIDLRLLCDDVVHELRRENPHAEFEVHGGAAAPVWADALKFGQCIQAAVELVRERIGGSGHIALTVQDDPSGPSLWVHGSGAPTSACHPHTARRFKQWVGELGLTVSPDAGGATGTGLVLRLPPSAHRSHDG